MDYGYVCNRPFAFCWALVIWISTLRQRFDKKGIADAMRTKGTALSGHLHKNREALRRHGFVRRERTFMSCSIRIYTRLGKSSAAARSST